MAAKLEAASIKLNKFFSPRSSKDGLTGHQYRLSMRCSHLRIMKIVIKSPLVNSFQIRRYISL